MFSITIRPIYSWTATCRPNSRFGQAVVKTQMPALVRSNPCGTLSFTGQSACGRVVTPRSTLTWRGWPGITQSVYRLGYGLDSPGFEARLGRGGRAGDIFFFRISGPALGLTRPPIHGAQGFFPSGKGAVACDEWKCTSPSPICLHGVDKDFKFLSFFLTWPDALWTSHFPTLVHFILWWVGTNAAEKCASPVFNLTS